MKDMLEFLQNGRRLPKLSERSPLVLRAGTWHFKPASTNQRQPMKDETFQPIGDQGSLAQSDGSAAFVKYLVTMVDYYGATIALCKWAQAIMIVVCMIHNHWLTINLAWRLFCLTRFRIHPISRTEIHLCECVGTYTNMRISYNQESCWYV